MDTGIRTRRRRTVRGGSLVRGWKGACQQEAELPRTTGRRAPTLLGGQRRWRAISGADSGGPSATDRSDPARGPGGLEAQRSLPRRRASRNARGRWPGRQDATGDAAIDVPPARLRLRRLVAGPGQHRLTPVGELVRVGIELDRVGGNLLRECGPLRFVAGRRRTRVGSQGDETLFQLAVPHATTKPSRRSCSAVATHLSGTPPVARAANSATR